MSFGLMDLVEASYRTARIADRQCDRVLQRLGYGARYLAARLAIARSLSLKDPPEPLDGDVDWAKAIRGRQLFGDGDMPNAWVALIVEHAGRADMPRKEFQDLVSAHWRRGAGLLTRDWEEANEDLGLFVARLADLAGLPTDEAAPVPDGGNEQDSGDVLASEFLLPVGPVSTDAETRKDVVFPLNAPGGSPHMAIMGGTNSGKTYTAITMIKKLRQYGPVPFLAFDFKGDLSEKLAGDIGAEVVSPPRVPVPLDVLAANADDNIAVGEAAGRIRESIRRIKSTKLGGVQAEALLAAIQNVLRSRTAERPAEIEDIARALSTEYQRRDRKHDELVSTLNELTQFALFDPRMPPGAFFGRSWIVKLPQDGTPEVRRLIVNLMLDCLDRWLNALEDAPIVEGRQSIRHFCLLDEAHVILRTRLPALSNLIRMSRSKGGVFMLVSQSPDDFEGQDEGFLDNMGITVAFNTQAKAGPTRRVFGSGFSLTEMGVGEALCRIRTETRTRRIAAWKPET